MQNLNIVRVLRANLTPAARLAAWNFFWMVLGRVVGQAAQVGVVLLLTHHLTQDQFGMFMTALAIQGYVLLVGSAGLPAVVVREMVQRPQDQPRIASTYLSMTAVMGFGAWTVLSVIVLFLPLGPSEKSLFILTSLAAAIASVNPEPLFDSQHAQATAAMLVLLGDLAMLAMTILVLLLNALSLPLLGLIFALKWLLTIVLLISSSRLQRLLSVRFVSFEEARSLWRASRYLLVTSFLGLVPVTGPTVVARLIGGPSQAAITGLAVQVLQLYMTFVMLAGRVLYPHVASPIGFDPSFIRKQIIFYVCFHGFLFTGTVIGSFFLVRYVLPDDYLSAFYPCLIMALAGLLSGATTITNYYLLGLKKETTIARAYALGCAIFIFSTTLASVLQIMHSAEWASCASFAGILIFNSFSMISERGLFSR